MSKKILKQGEPVGAAATHLEDQPIDLIHDRLNLAHAQLDLLYMATTANGTEELHANTLEYVTSSAMALITEALAAVDQLHATSRVSHG